MSETNVFIQYKGTDLCADIDCECGKHLHVDEYFAYTIKCGHCGTIYELPQFVTAVKVESSQWTPLVLWDEETNEAGGIEDV